MILHLMTLKMMYRSWNQQLPSGIWLLHKGEMKLLGVPVPAEAIEHVLMEKE